MAGWVYKVVISLVEARTFAYSEATAARGRHLLRKSSVVRSRGQINSNQFLQHELISYYVRRGTYPLGEA